MGIDIEKINPSIEKIACRFVRAEEEKFISTTERLNYLYIIWCAKEALYKLYGKRNLDFLKQIKIDSFSLGEQGNFKGHIINGSSSLEAKLYYRFIDEYVMVYTSV